MFIYSKNQFGAQKKGGESMATCSGGSAGTYTVNVPQNWDTTGWT